MKPYELLLILSGKLSEQETPAAITEVKELFKKFGVTIDKETVWGRLKLAYEIKGQTLGTYMLWQLSIEPAKVGGLSRELEVSDNVLRFLLTDRPAHGREIAAPVPGKPESAHANKSASASDKRPPRKPKAPAAAAGSLDEKIEEILGDTI
jgi:small subunit ribosomal protein S6